MPKHLIISGRVQGVGFRVSMRAAAARLGIGGWVRNRRDGTVEAVVDGDPPAVAAMIAWAKTGPPGARVTAVAVSDTGGEFTAFESRPTA
jgi:acylphosphatase